MAHDTGNEYIPGVLVSTDQPRWKSIVLWTGLAAGALLSVDMTPLAQAAHAYGIDGGIVTGLLTYGLRALVAFAVVNSPTSAGKL